MLLSVQNWLAESFIASAVPLASARQFIARKYAITMHESFDPLFLFSCLDKNFHQGHKWFIAQSFY